MVFTQPKPEAQAAAAKQNARRWDADTSSPQFFESANQGITFCPGTWFVGLPLQGFIRRNIR
jgi:hypothetical protein